MEQELLILKGHAKPLLQFNLPGNLFVHSGVVQSVGVSTILLCLIEGGIGVFQKCLSILPVMRIDTDAKTYGDSECMFSTREGGFK